MAGVNNLVTRGYGSFSNIGDVVTAGYSSGDNDIISDADASKIASYVWEHILEDGNEAQELMRLMVSAMAGLVSGMNNNNPIFKSLDGTKDRITATTDKNGNRTSITLDLT